MFQGPSSSTNTDAGHLPLCFDCGVFMPEELIPGLDTGGLPRIDQLKNDKRYGADGVGGQNATSYASILYSRRDFDGEREMWRKSLAGQVVVDLAGGCNSWGYLIACEGQAAAYVGLDAYNYRSLQFCLTPAGLQRGFEILREYDDPGYTPPARLIPRAVAPEDMLTFLKRVPDRSVSVLAIGLHYILDAQYAARVDLELARVISQSGCCIRYPEGPAVAPKGFKAEKCGCVWRYASGLEK